MKSVFHRIGLIVGMLLMLGTVGLGIYARQHGSLYIRTSGEPKETVRLFYDAILTEDYELAYACLLDYSTLGFEQEISGLAAELPVACREKFYKAVLDSYAYELVGEPEIQQRLNARQRVRFTCFCPEEFFQDVNARFYQMLNDNVQSRPRQEMFEADGSYRVHMLEDIYGEALEEALQYSGRYRQTMEYMVDLQYQNEAWKILVNEEMTESFMGRQR